MPHVTFIVESEEGNVRLDKFLATKMLHFNRTSLQNFIQKGQVSVTNTGKKRVITQNSYHVRENDSIDVEYIEKEESAAPSLSKDVFLVPSPMALDIRYEDDHMLVINKKAGITVHPGSNTKEPTLVEGVLAYCGESLREVGEVTRPGIVHRLDRDTTGLMMVAKTKDAHALLTKMIAERSVKRYYQALVWGLPSITQDTIHSYIMRNPKNPRKMMIHDALGKEAVTHYKVHKVCFGGLISQMEYRLETGRTHQIRVHSAHIGHTIVGDPLYGVRNRQKRLEELPRLVQETIRHFTRQALHAYYLGFHHPITQEWKEFTCELPEDLDILYKMLI